MANAAVCSWANEWARATKNGDSPAAARATGVLDGASAWDAGVTLQDLEPARFEWLAGVERAAHGASIPAMGAALAGKVFCPLELVSDLPEALPPGDPRLHEGAPAGSRSRAIRNGGGTVARARWAGTTLGRSAPGEAGVRVAKAAVHDGAEEAISGQGPLAVPAVVRATRVLETLVEMRAGASSTELALRCELAKSTTSNLLRTMVAEGLVSFDPDTRRYNLGPLLVEFGIAAISRTTAVAEARPFMEGLAEQTELACLAIQPMPDGHFTAIAKIESRKDIKVTIEVGARFDSSSPLLSRMAAAWGSRSGGMSAEGRASIRSSGYAAVFGEYRPELNVMGFPVFDREQHPALYITLLGIGDDLAPTAVGELSAYLVSAAREITARSGGTLPSDYPDTAVGSPSASS